MQISWVLLWEIPQHPQLGINSLEDYHRVGLKTHQVFILLKNKDVGYSSCKETWTVEELDASDRNNRGVEGEDIIYADSGPGSHLHLQTCGLRTRFCFFFCFLPCSIFFFSCFFLTLLLICLIICPLSSNGFMYWMHLTYSLKNRI